MVVTYLTKANNWLHNVRQSIENSTGPVHDLSESASGAMANIKIVLAWTINWYFLKSSDKCIQTATSSSKTISNYLRDSLQIMHM